MDEFGLDKPAAWLAHRVILAAGPLLDVMAGQREVAVGRRPPREPRCARSRSTRVCGGGSLRIS